MAAGAVPVSTYRLQLTPDFGFAQAAETADYLAGLGVSHVYLSPVLEAVPGSQHGYDVTDHARVRGELGGEDGFRAMAKRFRSHGLGIVVDIVPNHMAIPDQMPLNRQLWSVLKDGRDSPYATWFDIDWAAQEGRMLMPVLGGPVRDCLGDLVVEPGAGPEGEPVLQYFDHCLPLRPGTSRLPIAGLLESQHYRLAWWRDAATELNYRRFFDITSLIGIRMEDPAVFDAAHEVIARLVAEGLIDGLRVDHPDGLADPAGYLRHLAAATGGVWVVVEKILEAGERLPDDWPCAGTTGYDALRLADGLFVDPAGGAPLMAEWARLRQRSGLPDSDPPSFAESAETAKREILTGSLQAEVTRLARLVSEVFPDTKPDDARSVLVEVLVSLPVYRAYVNPGEPPPATAIAVLRDAVDAARRRLPRRLRGLASDVGAAALGTRGPVSGAAGRAAEFTVRFQQTAGPAQAKGVEDTAFYRWTRLISLNEVGGDPGRFGLRPEDFHAEAGHLAAAWPATMTTLSTHDTKRQEDVRARLAVLAEMPAEWGAYVAEWHERAMPPRLFGTGVPAVDPDTECLFWQTLVGAWPISHDRLAAYLTKAIREDKRRTSWTDPDAAYEAAVLGLASRVLDDGELAASIGSFVASIAADALANSLGVKLVQLTMPGVPDVYQGCELAGLSLVDPDNRRPVDFGRRRSLLADLDAGGGVDHGAAAAVGGQDPVPSLDAAKLLVTSRTLRLRRDHPDWFAGNYTPLPGEGAAASHAVAFARGGHAVTVATRLPAGLRRRGGWGDTVLPLPATASSWVDVFTGRSHSSGSGVPVAELTSELPVALLVPEDS